LPRCNKEFFNGIGGKRTFAAGAKWPGTAYETGHSHEAAFTGL
jgi:hypothetical protein